MDNQILHQFSSKVREIGEEAKENRTITFIISNEDRDRHGTILKTANWDLEAFNANPIIGYQHDVYGRDMCKKSDPDDVIGYGRAYLEEVDEKVLLLCDVTFEPREINKKADKIFKKVLNGSLRASSAGFNPIGGGTLINLKTGEEQRMALYPKFNRQTHAYIPDKQELLELSICNIPSNRSTLKRNLRNYAANALQFLKRELGQEFTYEEIGDLRVFDVMEMLEKGKKPERNVQEEPPQEEPEENDKPSDTAIREGTQKQKIKMLKIKGDK